MTTSNENARRLSEQGISPSPAYSLAKQHSMAHQALSPFFYKFARILLFVNCKMVQLFGRVALKIGWFCHELQQRQEHAIADCRHVHGELHALSRGRR